MISARDFEITEIITIPKITFVTLFIALNYVKV